MLTVEPISIILTAAHHSCARLCYYRRESTKKASIMCYLANDHFVYWFMCLGCCLCKTKKSRNNNIIQTATITLIWFGCFGNGITVFKFQHVKVKCNYGKIITIIMTTSSSSERVKEGERVRARKLKWSAQKITWKRLARERARKTYYTFFISSHSQIN